MRPGHLSVVGLLVTGLSCGAPDDPDARHRPDASPEGADGPVTADAPSPAPSDAAPEPALADGPAGPPGADALVEVGEAGWNGPAPTVLATGIDPNGALLPAAEHLYFGDASFPEELKRIPIGGGPAAERAVIANPVALAQAGGLLYVLDRGLSGGQVGRIGGRLFVAPLGPTVPLPDMDLAEDELEPHQLVLDGDLLYWSIKPNATTHVRRVNTTGQDVRTVITHEYGRAVGMAVVGDQLLFATSCCVATVARQGGAELVVLVRDQEPPIVGFAADREGFFLLVGSGAERDGSLLRFPLAGGSARPLAGGIRQPGQLLLHAGLVYWSDRGPRRFTPPMPVHIGGAVYQTSVETGSTVQLAGDLVQLTGFAVAGDRLYLATGSTQLRPPLDGKLLVVGLGR
jgi:hypothetical protein